MSHESAHGTATMRFAGLALCTGPSVGGHLADLLPGLIFAYAITEYALHSRLGAIATAAHAGARYGFQLLWAVLLATVCVIFLIEMVGRPAAVSQHTLADAIRERFGFDYFVIPRCAEVFSNLLLLGAEIGGVCLALQFLTGVSVQVWAVPVALVLWLFLWKGTFGLVETSTSLLGLITLCFVVAVVKLHPSYAEVGAGFIPSLPTHQKAHYWFTAVAVSSAIFSSYLVYFYSSGAVEDRWDTTDLGVNRATAALGMGFGSLVALGVLVVSTLVLHPRGIQLEATIRRPCCVIIGLVFVIALVAIPLELLGG